MAVLLVQVGGQPAELEQFMPIKTLRKVEVVEVVEADVELRQKMSYD